MLREGTGIRMAIRIGVLSLQGSVEEHMAMLARLDGVEAARVGSSGALESVDGLILPGGESTTMGKLLGAFGLSEPLRRRIDNGMPVWGTCAGMILLAKEIVGEAPHLALMDITVRRNAYGRQIDSFTCSTPVPALGREAIPLVFIRAPWIEHAAPQVEILCRLEGHIVAARERHMLVTSFHPELTECTLFHQYFAQMVRAAARLNQ